MNVLSNLRRIHSVTRAFVIQGLKFASLQVFLAAGVVAVALLGFTERATAQSQEMLRYGTPDPAPPISTPAPLVEKKLPTLAQMDPTALGELERLLVTELEEAATCSLG